LSGFLKKALTKRQGQHLIKIKKNWQNEPFSWEWNMRALKNNLMLFYTFVILLMLLPQSYAGIYDGNWTGTTDQGYSVSFSVTDNTISSFLISIRISGSYCTVTRNNKQFSAITIVGSSFSISGSSYSAPGSCYDDYSLSGTFSDASSCSGTYSDESCYCEGSKSVSWSATSVSKPNHDPELSSGDVDPNSGDTSTTFSYTVDYYDQDGDSPSTKYVYIDGSPHTMGLHSGSASNGTYRYQTTLSSGSHNYYFDFTDGESGSDRLPSSGTNSGPSVSEPTEPDISVSPSSHDFGDVPVGDCTEQIFVVSNDGNDTLHVTDSSIEGTDPDQFSIVSGEGSFDLDQGNEHEITVSFCPTSTGEKNAVLRIFSDDPDEPEKDVNLVGNYDITRKKAMPWIPLLLLDD